MNTQDNDDAPVDIDAEVAAHDRRAEKLSDASSDASGAPAGPAGDTDSEDELFEDELAKDEVDLEDGNIHKKVLRRGAGPRPRKSAEVKVHYVGTLLDGTEFDSSRGRGELFSFPLGLGRVIKGWDRGVRTMQKGELSEFVIQPGYAYGANGSPPKIPPNAALKFEIELVDFDSRINVRPDGTITKEVATEGTGRKANDGAKCSVKYSLRLAASKGTPEKVVEEGVERTLVLGEEKDMPAGLETCVLAMKKGEKSHFVVQNQHAFGKQGDEKRGVPPFAKVTYEIELLELELAKDDYEMTSQEKLDRASRRKAIGNDLFKLGQLDAAFAKYESVAKSLEFINDLDAEQQKTAGDIKEQCKSNMAACKVKTESWSEVISLSTEVLKMSPQNVKSLYRRAQGYFARGEFELATQDVKAALVVEPHNAAVKQLHAQIAAKIKANKEKERALFGNMFSKVKLTEAPAAKAPAAADASASVAPMSE